MNIYYDEGVTIPTKEEGSVGTDIYVKDDFVIPPKGMIIHDTGIVIDYSEDDKYVRMESQGALALHILPRSSLFIKKKVLLGNSVGLIDSNYNGKEDKIKLILYNTSDLPVEFKNGEKIAQFYFVKVYYSFFYGIFPMSENKNKDRGGLGSTKGWKE